LGKNGVKPGLLWDFLDGNTEWGGAKKRKGRAASLRGKKDRAIREKSFQRGEKERKKKNIRHLTSKGSSQGPFSEKVTSRGKQGEGRQNRLRREKARPFDLMEEKKKGYCLDILPPGCLESSPRHRKKGEGQMLLFGERGNEVMSVAELRKGKGRSLNKRDRTEKKPDFDFAKKNLTCVEPSAAEDAWDAEWR